MSISETEAKRLCRLSGAYCDPVDASEGAFRLSIAENGAQGIFRVNKDGNVSVEYWFADPLSGISLPHKKESFDQADHWLNFCRSLRSAKMSEQNVSEMFDPMQDNEANTETERLTKARLGQDIYRSRLETLWDDACAVTGIRQRELLRASHAKPWAECSSGAERLSPYNGFLLNVALDALFDKHLISFDEKGQILIADQLDAEELRRIGIDKAMRLRFIDTGHEPFLRYHREEFRKLSNV